MIYYCEGCKRYWKAEDACLQWKYVNLGEIEHEHCPYCNYLGVKKE